MSRISVEFRDAIAWKGLEWGESLRLPERMLRFLVGTKLTDQERLVILRLYSLLQDGQTSQDAQKLARWGVDRPESGLAAWINPTASLRDCLRPLYKHLYPEIGAAGYPLFLDGEFFSFVFPRQILPIIKLIPLTNPEGKAREVTPHFVFSFLIQLVAKKNEVVLRDDYYCCGHQLNLTDENLMYAISKVVMARPEFYVHVTNAALIEAGFKADILVADGEEDRYDEATRLFYSLRYGDALTEKLDKATLADYRQQWIRNCQAGDLDIETVIQYLPAVFEMKKDPNKVPDPHANFTNPASNLWGLILAARSRKERDTRPARRGVARI